jgi:hypothetical protein
MWRPHPSTRGGATVNLVRWQSTGRGDVVGLKENTTYNLVHHQTHIFGHMTHVVGYRLNRTLIAPL